MANAVGKKSRSQFTLRSIFAVMTAMAVFFKLIISYPAVALVAVALVLPFTIGAWYAVRRKPFAVAGVVVQRFCPLHIELRRRQR